MSNIRRSWPRGIIRYCWLIPVSALLIAGLTYVLDGMKPPTYTAVGRIFLAPNAPANGQQAEDVARTGQTQAKMLISNVVTREAAKELNLPEAALTGEVGADFATEASYITLSVSAPSARDAALRLVAVEGAYERARLTQRQAPYLAVKKSLQRDVTTITTDLANAQKGLLATPSDPRLNALQTSLNKQLTDTYDRIAEAGIAADSVGTGVGLFEPPDIPSVPTSPMPAVAAVIGFVLGGFVGALLALLIAWTREQRGAPSLEAKGLRRLGYLSANSAHASSLVSEAALSVLLEIDPSGRVIALLPVAQSPVVPQSAFALATALSESGQSVALIDGDRRRALLAALGKQDAALMGPSASNHSSVRAQSGNSTVNVVPAGPPGANLWPSNIDSLLGELKRSHRFVIVVVGYPFDCHLASAQVPDQHRWLPGVGRRVREWQ